MKDLLYFFYFKFPKALHIGLRYTSLAETISFLLDYFKAMRYTHCSMQDLVYLRKFVGDLKRRNVYGDIVECGSWKGGSSALMYKKAKRIKYDCTIWIFDSFEGLPPPAPVEIDGAKAQGINQGMFDWVKADSKDVEKIFCEFKLFNEKVHIIKGWFNESIPKVPINKISLLHCDGDLYESTKTTLDLLYSKVVPGGYVVSNDYGDVWVGAKRAVDECISKNCPDVDLMRIAGGGAYFIKP